MPSSAVEAEKNLALADVSECAHHVITTTHSIGVLEHQRYDTKHDVVDQAMRNIEMLKEKCGFGDSDIQYIKDLARSATEMRESIEDADSPRLRLNRRLNVTNYLDVAKEAVTSRALTMIAMAGQR